MPVRTWLFPSVDGDRIYQAEDFVAGHRDLTVNGYVRHEHDECEVMQTEPASMNILVSTGILRINGYRLEIYYEPEQLQVPIAHPSNPRIDRVVARLRTNTEFRDIILAVKQGTPHSSAPQPPALERDEEVYELSLAQVFVAGNATEVEQEDITDERHNPDVCGISGARTAFDVIAAGVPEGQVLTSMGNGFAEWRQLNLVGLGSLNNHQVFTSNGSFNINQVPVDIQGRRMIYAEVIGAGGGSGGSNDSPTGDPGRRSGGGGAGGGYAAGWVDANTLSHSIVTVGSGGSAGTGGTGTAGNGGSSSFGLFVSASGGEGGAGSNNNTFRASKGAIGGTGSGGQTRLQGGNGGAPTFNTAGVDRFPGPIQYGNGGNSPINPGGYIPGPFARPISGSAADSRNKFYGQGQAGTAGRVPGQGASGAYHGDLDIVRNGATGSDGLVTIRWAS